MLYINKECTCLQFPGRIFTTEEVQKAKDLIARGFKHQIKVEGSPGFRQNVGHILKLIKTAGYDGFFRTYIRRVMEIGGLTQLREAEATIWANLYAVENHVDGASFFMQKAYQMQEYLEGNLYYGGAAEARFTKKRVEFLEVLKRKSRTKEISAECERLIEIWRESFLAS